jgi:hypothetical protein
MVLSCITLSAPRGKWQVVIGDVMRYFIANIIMAIKSLNIASPSLNSSTLNNLKVTWGHRGPRWREEKEEAREWNASS